MKCNYICPILTSINKDGSINFNDMHKLYDEIINAGINGILVGGSAGEFYSFTYSEIADLILDATKYINNKSYIIAGTGRTVKSETISLSNMALNAGANAVIIISPYYSAVNDNDIFNYFDDIMGKINGNIFLYNYPERTGHDISVNTILKLKERHHNFIGIKDTHPVLRHTQRYISEIKTLYPDFKIFSGYDNNCVGTVLSGGDGCIGALSNIYPNICSNLITALTEENLSKIMQLQKEIDNKFKFYEVYTPFNPIMKWAMKELNMPMQEYCREPLGQINDINKSALSDIANNLWRK